MSDICEHETFKDVCGICHRDKAITALRAENERLREALEEVRALVLGANHSETRYPLARAALSPAVREGT